MHTKLNSYFIHMVMILNIGVEKGYADMFR